MNLFVLIYALKNIGQKSTSTAYMMDVFLRNVDKEVEVESEMFISQ